jgi:heme oxygenase
MTTMTLLERLRAETRTRHEQMEAAFALPDTREQHRRWTAAFLGFLEPLEREIAAALGPNHRFIAGRTKAAWLREDLRALGMDEAGIAALPRGDDLPALDTNAGILGVLYVFEGATLGGQLISRHLEEKLGFRDGAGYRYFRSYGPETGRRWQEFRALLLENSGPGADDAMVAAANDTFERLLAWCLASHGRN